MDKVYHKISVVIPSYNQGQYIEDTIRSVVAQDYPNVEIIVMDGGSTDNSVDVIKKYESSLTYWQSQKDNGQSAAINEGFKKATGEFVTWLNSDDIFLPGTLHCVNDYINKYPATKWFLGNLFWMDKIGTIIRTGKVESESRFWNKHFLFSNGGPSAFMNRERLIELGLLREDFHYMMDTELWYRFLSNGDFFVRINRYCWGLRLHEAAKMSGHNFANSELAQKSHPSWIQKKKEGEEMASLYPQSAFIKRLWRFSKVFSIAYLTNVFERKWLGKNINEYHK